MSRATSNPWSAKSIGMPVAEQPVAVNLINTRTNFRGALVDQLSDLDAAKDWLWALATHCRQPHCSWVVDKRRLLLLRATRFAITHLASVQTGHASPSDETRSAVAYLNRNRLAARFLVSDTGVSTAFGAGDAFEAFRQSVIDSAAATLAAPPQLALRHCAHAECLHYFVPYVTRQKWCSSACGNRARVARYEGRA